MAKGRIRHMFAGGNTSKGFVSFFNHIIDYENARRLFILKGGPGTGKSTFMRKIAAELLDKGFDVEFMHCSSDNSSLDGIAVPGVGVAVIDGTAPHVVDPRYPGATDEIINLGEFWNEEGITGHRKEISEISDEIKKIFAGGYRYLMAARHLYEDSAEINGRFMDKSRINTLTREIIDDIWPGVPYARKAGRQRCLFASAITPDGLKDYLDDILITDNIIILEGFPGAGTEDLLERVKNAAVERGFDTECYYCAFIPEKLEHLVIPELKISFTTSNRYHSTDACPIRKINFRDFLDEKAGAYESRVEFNQSMTDCLINKAVETIHRAKMLHDRLESFYIPSMDFEAIRQKRLEVMGRIEKYIL